MAKKAITMQWDEKTVEDLKKLADGKGWAFQVTAEKAAKLGMAAMNKKGGPKP